MRKFAESSLLFRPFSSDWKNLIIDYPATGKETARIWLHVATRLGMSWCMSWFEVSVLLYNIIVIVSSMTSVYHLLFRETWRNTSAQGHIWQPHQAAGHRTSRDSWLGESWAVGPRRFPCISPMQSSKRNAHVQRGKVLLALAIATCRFLQAVEMERDFAAAESCKWSMNVLKKQASTDESLINFCSTYMSTRMGYQ